MNMGVYSARRDIASFRVQDFRFLAHWKCITDVDDLSVSDPYLQTGIEHLAGGDLESQPKRWEIS
jgi:hypothetical protein